MAESRLTPNDLKILQSVQEVLGKQSMYTSDQYINKTPELLKQFTSIYQEMLDMKVKLKEDTDVSRKIVSYMGELDRTVKFLQQIVEKGVILKNSGLVVDTLKASFDRLDSMSADLQDIATSAGLSVQDMAIIKTGADASKKTAESIKKVNDSGIQIKKNSLDYLGSKFSFSMGYEFKETLKTLTNALGTAVFGPVFLIGKKLFDIFASPVRSLFGWVSSGMRGVLKPMGGPIGSSMLIGGTSERVKDMIEYYDKHALKNALWVTLMKKLDAMSLGVTGKKSSFLGDLFDWSKSPVLKFLKGIGGALATLFGFKGIQKIGESLKPIGSLLKGVFDKFITWFKAPLALALAAIVGWKIGSWLEKNLVWGGKTLGQHVQDAFETHLFNVKKLEQSKVPMSAETDFYSTLVRRGASPKDAYSMTKKQDWTYRARSKPFWAGRDILHTGKRYNMLYTPNAETMDLPSVGGTQARDTKDGKVHSPRYVVEQAEIMSPVVFAVNRMDKNFRSAMDDLSRRVSRLQERSASSRQDNQYASVDVNINSIPSMIDDLGLILINSGVI